MSLLPRTYTVARKGEPCQITVRDTDELIRLRSELDLVARAGAAAGPDVAAVLAQTADRLSDPPIRELQHIVEDAHNPINAVAIARMDADFPSVREELEIDVIESEAERLRDDIARCAGQASAEGASTNQPALSDEPAATAVPESTESELQSPHEVDEMDAELGELEGVLAELDAAGGVLCALEEVETAVEGITAEVVGPDHPPGDDAEAGAAVEPGQAVETGQLGERAEDEPAADDPLEADENSAPIDEATVPATANEADGGSVEEAPEDAATGQEPASGREATDPVAGHAAAEPTYEATVESPVAADSPGATRADTFNQPEDAAPAVGLTKAAPVDPADGDGLVDEVKASFNHLGQFFALQANRLWRQARHKLEEATQSAEQTQVAQDRARAILGDVQAWLKEASEAAEAAQVLRREAANYCDQAEQALERAACKANEAENAADRALAEAKQAEKYAEPSRRGSQWPISPLRD